MFQLGDVHYQRFQFRRRIVIGEGRSESSAVEASKNGAGDRFPVGRVAVAAVAIETFERMTFRDRPVDLFPFDALYKLPPVFERQVVIDLAFTIAIFCDAFIADGLIILLRNAGPLGGPGMPEWGMLPIPKALLKQGHRDMLRISDARMSGTSYGACVLHVAPESYVGGPLALLKTGDTVRLDLPNRRLDMLVDEAELEKRRAAWKQPKPRFERGWGWMFSRHVTQADQGCDFDFLQSDFGRTPGEPDIF